MSAKAEPARPPESRAKLRVVVVGGGTAGWMTAATLAHLLPHRCTVELVESEEIGIVGVGEATLPHLRAFNERLGLDEAEFMAATQATYKLGIEFKDWGRIGGSYIHPFGDFGRPVAGVPFHHYWLRAQAEGRRDEIGAYSVPVVAARMARFAPPGRGTVPVQHFGWAYHFDATLFGPYLRTFACRKGVSRIEGRVVSVERDGGSGDIASVTLGDGRVIAGDLFVDCSGFRSLLLGEALGEPWEDWSGWLPCDRAVALPCARTGPLLPYTQAAAMPAGWRWRIPLRHRTGNGYVYSSAHLSDEAAAEALLAALDGAPGAEPRFLRFRSGRRNRSCVANCVGVGLASGFLEPLESTSIYLAQVAIQNLVALFPAGRFTASERDEFNRLVDLEYDRVRDFLILHYVLTTRADSRFWTDLRAAALPDSLQERMELWRRRGRVKDYRMGLFLEPSWVAVFLGQGLMPDGFDQRVQAISSMQLTGALDRLAGEVDTAARAMPDHEAALRACVGTGAA